MLAKGNQIHNSNSMYMKCEIQNCFDIANYPLMAYLCVYNETHITKQTDSLQWISFAKPKIIGKVDVCVIFYQENVGFELVLAVSIVA